LKREATPAPISAGVPATTDPNANHPSPNSGSFEEKIIRVQKPELALTISAVYRAVELKAKTIGQMEMQFQRRNKAGGNFVPAMWGPGKKINYLLQKRANPMMMLRA
jgi:hypothetical protein